MKKACKLMMELMTGEASLIFAQGHSCTLVTNLSDQRISIK